MSEKKAMKLINKIMKADCATVGIFISLLVDTYTRCYDISEKDFNRSLKNSLRILREDDQNEKN